MVERSQSALPPRAERRQATAAELEAWDRSVLWHPFTQMQEYAPLIIERARGCTLIDIHGREYLDGVSSLWCNVHGHAHPALDAALRRQLEDVAHVTLLGMSSRVTVELAARLVEVAPAGLGHVFFSSDGASAVEAALKMAFQYWRQTSPARPEKTKFLAFDEAYHGDTLGSVSVGGVDRFHELFRPLLFDVIRAPVPDTYRLPEGVTAEQAADHYTQRLEQLLAQHHTELAAVIIEPLVQGAAGMVMHPPGFLRAVRQLTRRYDVLLIADEVAVGFGRTGTMFACQQEDVTPDLLCLGKGLSAGYLPLSATLATDPLWQAFLGTGAQWRQFSHGHTYGGNPLASAVALASLDVFDQQHVLELLPAKIARLSEHLARLAQLPWVGDARQCGLIGAIELVADKSTKARFPAAERRAARICQRALHAGVWIRPLGDVLVLMPPLSITPGELDRLCLVIEDSLQQESKA